MQPTGALEGFLRGSERSGQLQQHSRLNLKNRPQLAQIVAEPLHQEVFVLGLHGAFHSPYRNFSHWPGTQG